jgi:hypothetical protein
MRDVLLGFLLGYLVNRRICFTEEMRKTFCWNIFPQNAWKGYRGGGRVQRDCVACILQPFEIKNRDFYAGLNNKDTAALTAPETWVISDR